jgi:anti-sigma factor ChrR (cupin superfamily)
MTRRFPDDRPWRENVPPREALREEVFDLLAAPPLPIDLSAYPWQDAGPGIRVHELRVDPVRGMRGVLVWAKPGARTMRHRHLGDEVILVLQGALRDDEGRYGPGQVCRSRAGSVHTEEVLPGDDCICYVVYYGGHEPA